MPLVHNAQGLVWLGDRRPGPSSSSPCSYFVWAPNTFRSVNKAKLLQEVPRSKHRQGPSPLWKAKGTPAAQLHHSFCWFITAESSCLLQQSH